MHLNFYNTLTRTQNRNNHSAILLCETYLLPSQYGIYKIRAIITSMMVNQHLLECSKYFSHSLAFQVSFYTAGASTKEYFECSVLIFLRFYLFYWIVCGFFPRAETSSSCEYRAFYTRENRSRLI